MLFRMVSPGLQAGTSVAGPKRLPFGSIKSTDIAFAIRHKRKYSGKCGAWGIKQQSFQQASIGLGVLAGITKRNNRLPVRRDI